MSRAVFTSSTILAVTIGSILEFYELGLYIYWAPLIGRALYDASLPIAETINTITAICIGFFARPLGAFLFGKSGDSKGRKKAFTWAIILISIPTFAIGLTRSFADWNLFVTIYLAFMKFLQGVPAGGEVPGAICFLAEESESTAEKKFTCSFAFVGPQIGLLVSLGICMLLEKFLPYQFLVSWGWRITFLMCGFIGIFGYFLRKELHETHEFKMLEKGHQIIERPVKAAFTFHKKELVLGFMISIFEVVSFCLLTIVPVLFFKKHFNITENQNLLISLGTLFMCALLPPIIGKIAQKFNHKNFPFMEVSAWGILLLSPIFYLAILKVNLLSTLTLKFFIIVLFSIQVALLPSYLAELFPTAIRYTGIGFSFNICDGILWGIIPIVGIFLVRLTNQLANFVILFPIAAIIFLISFHFFKKFNNERQASS